MKKFSRNFFNFFVFFKQKFITYNNKENSIDIYCDQNNIKNTEDCLLKIFNYLKLIENFLIEYFEVLKELEKKEKFKNFLKGKLFSFHYTIMAIYNIIKEIFINEYDFKFLIKILKKKFPNKYEENINIKESSEFEADKANEIKLDYLKKNEKKFTEKVKKNF